MVLRYTQNHKNNNRLFSYFEPLVELESNFSYVIKLLIFAIQPDGFGRKKAS